VSKEAREATRRYIIRKVRHAMLCSGTTPEMVDGRLGWRRGTTRSLVRGWPSRPHKIKGNTKRPNLMTLNDVSDICFACGGEMNVRLVPIEDVEREGAAK